MPVQDAPVNLSSSFSTADLAPADRALAWRDRIWSHFGGLESDFYGDRDFDGRIDGQRAGDAVLTHLKAGRHRVLRSDGMARAADDAYLKIVAPVAGCAGVRQHGRTAWVRPGSWTIYDMSAPYVIDNPDRAEHMILMLPKAGVAEAGLALQPLMARPLDGARGLARLTRRAMHDHWHALPDMQGDLARQAGELLARLVRLSLLELAGTPTDAGLKAAQKDRVRLLVEQHLGDPALSVAGIAQALACSKRYLHKLFEDEDATLTAYILKRRLEACARALRSAADARSLTGIALACGFTNMSHFSRAFRAHTGASPSAFRRAARAGG